MNTVQKLEKILLKVFPRPFALTVWLIAAVCFAADMANFMYAANASGNPIIDAHDPKSLKVTFAAIASAITFILVYFFYKESLPANAAGELQPPPNNQK